MAPLIPKCTDCGACCAHSDEFVPVRYEDSMRLPQELLVCATHAGKWDTVQMPPYVMRMVGREKRCIALRGEIGEGVSCDVYRNRPKVCRALKRGSMECCYMLGVHRVGRPW